jgi:hypothetical protein
VQFDRTADRTDAATHHASHVREYSAEKRFVFYLPSPHQQKACAADTTDSPMSVGVVCHWCKLTVCREETALT